tara:strand:- start:428 stop:1009 length:582 start_codon:yes stop_codon:yes gene_type:complete
MCEPATIATGLMIASTAATAYGQYQAADAAAQGLAQKAEFEELDAQIQENNAILSRQAATADANTIQRQREVMLGRQAAGYAKSGVVINEGSTLEVFGDTAAEFELTRLSRIHQGDVAANAARIAADQKRNRAKQFIGQAKSARQAGMLQVAGTLLGGGAGIAGNLPSSSSGSGPLTSVFGSEGGQTYAFDRP